MKTKILLLSLLVSLSSSCIKDYLGNGSKKVEITEKNYLYPDDVKTAFLENVNLELSIELKKLESIIDAGQADQQTKARYATIKSEFATNNATLNNLANERARLLKIIPPPPCPKPRNCNGWLDILYLTPRPGAIAFQALIYDASQNVIAETQGTPQPLVQFNGDLNYIDLIWKNRNYKGDITVKIIEINGTNLQEVYFINSKIE